MPGGVYTVEVRLATAATQFTAAAPIVSFAEYVTINTEPPSTTARILGYQYNSGTTATGTVAVTLRRPGGVNADQFILLENRSSVTDFVVACGPQGIVVPRQYGQFGTAIPPATPVITGESYQLFVVTTGKNSAASFICWYAIGQS